MDSSWFVVDWLRLQGNMQLADIVGVNGINQRGFLELGGEEQLV